MKKNNLDIKKFRIFHDNVLVEPVIVEERDGIIKPTLTENKPELGKVLSIGPGRWLESGDVVPMQVKVGETVYFNQYSSTKINLDGTTYYIVREEDIVGAR